MAELEILDLIKEENGEITVHVKLLDETTRWRVSLDENRIFECMETHGKWEWVGFFFMSRLKENPKGDVLGLRKLDQGPDLEIGYHLTNQGVQN